MTVGGAPTDNPARLVARDEPLTVLEPPPTYVSRGGDKLAAALVRFAVDVRGLRILDAGSSTGGFTDCLLQAGADRVVAVDVGRGQLHQRLRTDERVSVHERVNLRHLAAGDLGDPVDVVVADLSFISLRTVLPNLMALAGPDADLILLVKPQFEATRDEVDAAGGVLTDPRIWRRVLLEIAAAIRDAGATIMGIMSSPIRGAHGNVEFLLHATRGRRDTTPPDPHVIVDAAIDEVVTR